MGINILCEVSTNYIIAQCVGVVALIFSFLSLQLKERKSIFNCQIIANIAYGVSFAFLGGWFGIVMSAVATIRFIVFVFVERKGHKETIWSLIIVYALYIIAFCFVSEGWYSLLMVGAGFVFTYGCWQKSDIVLRVCAIIIGTVILVYNIFYISITGIIMESLFILSAVIYLIRKAIERHKNLKQNISN